MMDGVYPTEKQLDEHLRDVQAGDSDPHRVMEPWDYMGDGDIAGEDGGDGFYGTGEFLMDGELERLIQACVEKDIKLNDLTYPPDKHAIFELAYQFYDTYLSDTAVDRATVLQNYTDELTGEILRLHEEELAEIPTEEVERKPAEVIEVAKARGFIKAETGEATTQEQELVAA